MVYGKGLLGANLSQNNKLYRLCFWFSLREGDMLKFSSRFCVAKETINKMKNTHRIRENICKQTTRVWSPKYTKSSCNSISKKQRTESKSGQIKTDIFSKEDTQVARRHMQDAQYQWFLEKCKSKLWGITLHQLGWPSSKIWRGCGEKETLLHCWWKCKLVQTLWRMA